MLRCAIFGVMAALETVLLYIFMPREDRTNIYYTGVSANPTFPAVATMMAFLVVFRQQFAYNRFRQGRTELQSMTASLFTVVSNALSFDKGGDQVESLPTTPTRQSSRDDFLPSENGSKMNEDLASNSNIQIDAADIKAKSAENFRNSLIHVASLLHATCLQHLRNDWEVTNLITHDENILPAWDSGNSVNFTPKITHYLFPPWNRIKSRVKWNAASQIGVIGGVSWLEQRQLRSGAISRIDTFTRDSAHLASIIARNATKDENTGAIKKSKSSHHFKHTDLRFTTSVPKTDGSKPELKRSKSIGGKLWSSDTGEVVRGANERPYQLFYALTERLRRRMAEGRLDMPSPILATLWQSIAAAVQSFESCRYLQDTPFPFPWAQLNVAILVVWQIITPFAVVASLKNRAIGILLSVVATWLAWAINESSRDMEDPFVMEPNDLPLARLQYTFNQRLLAVAHIAESNNAASVFFTSTSALKGENTVQTYQGGVDTTILSGVVGV